MPTCLDYPVNSQSVADCNDVKSRMLGVVDWDEGLLEESIETIDEMPVSSSYSEYSVGKWGSIVLANKTGDHRQGDSCEYLGSAKPTELGLRVPYLWDTLNRVFNMNFAQSVRVFTTGAGGQIVTHCDYLEFRKGFTRIHMPLRSSDECLNSEKNSVYHMHVGQIVFLDGHHPHSAVAQQSNARFASKDDIADRWTRLHLVVDCNPDVSFGDLFRDQACRRVGMRLDMRPRPALPEAHREQLCDLGTLMTHANFREVHGLLNHVHFKYDVPAQETYVLLLEAARRSRDASLLKRARCAAEYFLGPDHLPLA